MIYFNDKIVNANNWSIQRCTNEKRSIIERNIANQTDSVSFSGAQSSEDKTQNKNKLITYIAGGALLAAGIIFAIIKLKNGKAPSSDIGKDLEKGMKNLENDAASSVPQSTSNANNGYHSSSRSKTASLDSEINQIHSVNVESEKKLADSEKKLLELKNKKQQLQQQLNKIDEEPKEIEILKQQKADLEAKGMQLDVEQAIKIIKPKNEELAKEALPQLFKYSEKLGIPASTQEINRFHELDKYINQITPENKDFAINEGIPLIAENMEKFKSALNDPENSHGLLSVLNTENKDFLSVFLNKTDKSKFDKVQDVISALKLTTPENKKFIAGIIEESEKYKINNVKDVISYVNEIKPEKRYFAFNEVMPLIMKYNDKLKIASSNTMTQILGHITPETKDSIKIIAEHSDQLKLDNNSLSVFFPAITSKNMKCIPTIAENADKLGIRDWMYTSDFSELLNKGKEGIIKEANKS